MHCAMNVELLNAFVKTPKACGPGVPHNELHRERRFLLRLYLFLRAKQTVASVAKARHDVSRFIETFIERGDIQFHVRA